jgi:TetR/AcrR family transcriptional regulator, transcriptional repressor for nem operon
MASKHPDTRDAILKTASHLVQSRGFSAFSFGHVADALDMKAPAVHYHFPSKTDLGLALVERYRDRYRRWIDEASDQGLPAAACLEGYFRIATRWCEDNHKVCPIGILSSEFHALPEPMQVPVAAMIEEVTGWLARILANGRRDGTLAFRGNAPDVANLVVCALQGGLQNSRALGRSTFDGVLRQLRDALGMTALPTQVDVS